MLSNSRPIRPIWLLPSLGALLLGGCHPAKTVLRPVNAVPTPVPSNSAVPPPNDSGNPPPPLPAGTPAPTFSTVSLHHQPLSLTSLHGKVVLLDFWATWCDPCRAATPLLQSLHKQFAGQGLRVVGISVDQADTIAQVKPFVKAFGITYQISTSPDANSPAATAYQVNGIPSQYLIDKNGIVRWSQSGFDPEEGPQLANRIRQLLAEPDN